MVIVVQGFIAEEVPTNGETFGLFTGARFLGDLLSPGVGLAVGAIDTFVVDQIRKRWRPHYFVENDLRGFLEKAMIFD